MEIKEVVERLKGRVEIDLVEINDLKLAISALEKQQPRKARNTKLASGKLGDNGIMKGECPCCGETVTGNWYGEYCGCCGQKIDWREAYNG